MGKGNSDGKVLQGQVLRQFKVTRKTKSKSLRDIMSSICNHIYTVVLMVLMHMDLIVYDLPMDRGWIRLTRYWMNRIFKIQKLRRRLATS